MTRNLDYYSMDVAGDLGRLWKYLPRKEGRTCSWSGFFDFEEATGSLGQRRQSDSSS
jgi:hypothetical protein